MKLNTILKKSKKTISPYYKFSIDFMEGDADGYQSSEIEIPADEIEDYHGLILAAAMCDNYFNGKGGYDDYRDIPEYNAFFNEEIIDENDEEMIKLNPNGIYMEHPYYGEGYVTEFDGIKLTYIDENRQAHPVEIKFSPEEQSKIDNCKYNR